MGPDLPPGLVVEKVFGTDCVYLGWTSLLYLLYILHIIDIIFNISDLTRVFQDKRRSYSLSPPFSFSVLLLDIPHVLIFFFSKLNLSIWWACKLLFEIMQTFFYNNVWFIIWSEIAISQLCQDLFCHRTQLQATTKRKRKQFTLKLTFYKFRCTANYLIFFCHNHQIDRKVCNFK